MKIKSEKIVSVMGIVCIVLVILTVILQNLNLDPQLAGPLSLALLSFLAISIISAFVAYQKSVVKPLNEVSKAVRLLSEGGSSDDLKVQSFGVVADIAKDMNEVFHNMQAATVFAQEIGEGNFESEAGDVNENDALTTALLDMRDKLKDVAEEEKKRNWAVQGLATFSELLRNNQDDLEELGYNVIKNLVKYLGANQGGFFTYKPYDGNDAVSEEDALFKGKVELVSCYAYEKRKYKVKEVFVGEGLVGQCVVEGETIYLNDVPGDYVNITSGLGKATPRSILIVPLQVNEEIFGVVEIASFKNIEDYQVKFVEDLSESIASTLSSVKMAMNTKTLLDKAEEANKEMRSKEEQMEEIQDELAEKLKQNEEDTARFMSVVEAINKTNAAIEFDMKGNIIEVNDMFLGVMGFRKEDLIGMPESFLLPEDEKESPQHSMMWESLKTGQYFSGEFRRLSKSGKDVWMNGTYNPIHDAQNVPYKIIKFASFTTDEKERELDLNGKLNALKESVGVIELDMEKKLRSVNGIILSDLGYKRLETRNKPFELFTGEEYMKGRAFKSLWAGLNDGDTVTQSLTFKKKGGGEKYYKGNFSTIKNLKGEVIKILCVLVDISKEVEAEKALKEELEAALNNSMIKVADEEKDTQGAMVALNDALEELNQGDLSVDALIEKNKLPIIILNKDTAAIENSTLVMQALLGYENAELVGKSFSEFLNVDEDKLGTINKGIGEAGVFQEEIVLKGKGGDQNLTVLFAPILGNEEDGTKICMIALSMF